MKKICVLAILMAMTSMAQTVRLEWDASPTPGVSYRLYAHTNTFSTGLTNATVRLDAGTNLTAQVQDLAPGMWRFAATAYTTNGVESFPSNVLLVSVPIGPANLRTVVLQFNATVSGTNWMDAGFFRVKFGP